MDEYYHLFTNGNYVFRLCQKIFPCSMSTNLIRNAVYSVLDLVTLRKGIARQINNRTVLFPPRWFRYFESNYDSENYAFLEDQLKFGMHVIDIGAHIGLFS